MSDYKTRLRQLESALQRRNGRYRKVFIHDESDGPSEYATSIDGQRVRVAELAGMGETIIVQIIEDEHSPLA